MSERVTYPESSVDPDVLDHAADILETRGRVRGCLSDGGAVCAIGAICLAVAEQYHGRHDVAPLDLDYPDDYAFTDAVTAALLLRQRRELRSRRIPRMDERRPLQAEQQRTPHRTVPAPHRHHRPKPRARPYPPRPDPRRNSVMSHGLIVALALFALSTALIYLNN